MYGRNGILDYAVLFSLRLTEALATHRRRGLRWYFFRHGIMLDVILLIKCTIRSILPMCVKRIRCLPVATGGVPMRAEER